MCITLSRSHYIFPGLKKQFSFLLLHFSFSYEKQKFFFCPKNARAKRIFIICPQIRCHIKYLLNSANSFAINNGGKIFSSTREKFPSLLDWRYSMRGKSRLPCKQTEIIILFFCIQFSFLATFTLRSVVACGQSSVFPRKIHSKSWTRVNFLTKKYYNHEKMFGMPFNQFIQFHSPELRSLTHSFHLASA